MARIGRAIVMVGKDLVLREYPVPEPEPGTVLLRQELSGICGTDVHNWEHQRLSGEILLGHENVGTIEALGAGVTHDFLGKPLAVGDRVVLSPGTPAGAYGFQQADEPPYFRGGFADYIYLWHPESCILKTSLPPEVGVLTEPFSVGVHGVSRSGIQFGDTVVVQGSGAIGLMTLVAARARGAGRLIVVGGPAGRLALARAFGADVTVDITTVKNPDERTRLVLAETPHGEGADVVFEAAGFLPAIPEGLGYLRRSGTFVEMGHFVDVGTLEINPNQQLMRKNLRLEAVWGTGGNDNFVRAFKVLERGELPIGQLVTPLPIERAMEGFRALSGSYRLGDRDVVKVALHGSAR
ncbi:MAG: zinc-binding dehydrogenase [Chloroflexi bacterium]|nr:zinc-binding dehydrogenase [Chloroflexota bacterium]